ncbi:glycosyltransferase-like domain-containing protein 1 isoform X2 [Nematostella vectensis]|uniref:glycosyltransferase-like domain-containing protein 1 isoform X2 n=1 Tax=Nematostella vectensis TaxID=45351 RepID=UPI002076FC5C|nr:glycosyltransferase-like domain-containing protein 1 isoform X2 [Nematostella vectensis]
MADDVSDSVCCLSSDNVSDMAHILLIEPFCGGSHRQLMEILGSQVCGTVHYCLSAKKWHWRMRTGALYFSQNIPKNSRYRILFASSVLNLSELIALRPDLAALRKIIYFHENQLVYPVRKQQERDFQYGYNQILSCLVADVVVFNSLFNMTSFLNNIDSFLKLMPDHRPNGIYDQIKPKCQVVYFPLQYLDISKLELENQNPREHDKDPELFFQTLFHLIEEGLSFNVSVLGEGFSQTPDVFHKARPLLGERVLHWGYQESRSKYLEILKDADVAVSTAKHEFFGVAMLEAVQCGCYPLCPKDLVYPEIYPEQYLYSTPGQLAKRLRYLCKNPGFARHHKTVINLEKFTWDVVKQSYMDLLGFDDITSI